MVFCNNNFLEFSSFNSKEGHLFNSIGSKYSLKNFVRLSDSVHYFVFLHGVSKEGV
jgi:hypothetical protein